MTAPDPRAFLKIAREEPAMRPPTVRRHDFRPVYEPPHHPTLSRQAARCMGCGVPFCQGPTGCPLGNLIPDWNERLRFGDAEEALRLLHATNNFPEFTGLLCPAPCESACVLDLVSEPVTIRAIESGIVERGFADGLIRPHAPPPASGHRIAIVGSGPAGLAAAQQLVRLGHAVTVFERDARPGGLLRYGIPDFKLDKSVVDRRLAQLAAEGVKFRNGITIGSDITMEALKDQFDAVCLTTGAGAGRDLDIPGRDLEGVHLAMDYLTAQNRLLAGETMTPAAMISAKGKRVVIIGGGDTGADCLGTAHRQGAAEVLQLELMPEPPQHRAASTPWPHWPLRLNAGHAHEEGGTRAWQILTQRFTGAKRHVTAIEAIRVERRNGSYQPVEGGSITIPADLVLIAIGFKGPSMSTNAQYMTSDEGVFAAGDARRGASLIVWAIAEGRRLAASANAYLSRRNLQ